MFRSNWLLSLAILALMPLSGCQSNANKQNKSASKEPLRVYLIRHAQSYSNLKDPKITDPEKLDSLTQKGRIQAHETGVKLAKLKPKQVVILTSPTNRTKQTAEAIRQVLNLPELTITTELLPIKSGSQKDGKPADWAWRQQQWKQGEDPIPQNGESMATATDRVIRLINSYSKTNQSLVLVTHSDICAGLIGHAKGTAPQKRYARHKPKNAELKILEFDGENWRVIAMKSIKSFVQ